MWITLSRYPPLLGLRRVCPSRVRSHVSSLPPRPRRAAWASASHRLFDCFPVESVGSTRGSSRKPDVSDQISRCPSLCVQSSPGRGRVTPGVRGMRPLVCRRGDVEAARARRGGCSWTRWHEAKLFQMLNYKRSPACADCFLLLLREKEVGLGLAERLEPPTVHRPARRSANRRKRNRNLIRLSRTR